MKNNTLKDAFYNCAFLADGSMKSLEKMMLKKIPKILSSDLVKILMDMGHGNELCIANANFPAYDLGKRVITLGTESITHMLENVLDYMPLDVSEANPVILMEYNAKEEQPPLIWDDYKKVILRSEENEAFSEFSLLNRLDFYSRANGCYAIVLTNDMTLRSNIILRKGVIRS